MWTLALLVACSAASSTFSDFALKQAAYARFGSAVSLVRFFAVFYTGASLVSFLLQVLVSISLLATIAPPSTKRQQKRDCKSKRRQEQGRSQLAAASPALSNKTSTSALGRLLHESVRSAVVAALAARPEPRTEVPRSETQLLDELKRSFRPDISAPTLALVPD